MSKAEDLLKTMSPEEIQALASAIIKSNAGNPIVNKNLSNFLEEIYATVENTASLAEEISEDVNGENGLSEVAERIINGYTPKVSKSELRNLEGLIDDIQEYSKKLESRCYSLMQELQYFIDPEGVDKD